MEAQTTTIYGRTDIQKLLGVNRNTALKLITSGAFPNAFRIVNNWRIPSEDVEAFKQRNRVKPIKT